MPSTTCSRWCRAVLPGCFLFSAALILVPFLAAPTAHSHKRDPVVRFELGSQGATGVLDPGEPFDLTVSLSGVSQGKDSIVAIVEGEPFVRRLVPMKRAPQETAFRGSVKLEPYFAGAVSARERALRVDITFARLRGMRLDRFLTRSVYLTMGLPVEAAGLNTAPYSETEDGPITGVERGREGVRSVPADALTFRWPMVTEDKADITEQDLILGPIPALESSYWQRISHLISRSWSGPASQVTRKKARGTVEVRFRLYANGEAQLIQVEQSSGSRLVDEAGMQAILNAHPFPPFPGDLGPESVDLHVELSRSGRAVHRAVQPASSRALSTKSARP